MHKNDCTLVALSSLEVDFECAWIDLGISILLLLEPVDDSWAKAWLAVLGPVPLSRHHLHVAPAVLALPAETRVDFNGKNRRIFDYASEF